MIFTSDKDYKSTKKIKQGISTIKKEFEPLAKWIDQKYDVKTLNIIFDYIHKNKSQPRIQICLEYARDKGKFMDNKTYNFDKRKQKEVAEKFAEITSNYELENKTNWIKRLFKLIYKSKNVFVYFSDFETIAKDEANKNIPEKEIKKLKTEINNPELWGIDRRFNSVTYFLQTDEQLKKYEYSETHKKWKEQYFELLKEYDEFKYFKKEYFNIHLDSKENFDTNYESNWYYYYK
ncbi:hypothetical protein H9W90_10475 [Polaribacter pectinis]|uniref:Uncharacterized protein n=1 Tax=Polaribacter pectinis TaxID=2738844 RepID=A0A7G9L7M2_9FLAO|nr:hypothetical protein [Polaribacter pectinis]QNM84621.1 hypothetical protein H9W90_10475 [Polaribacter pectinis]